MAAAMRNWERGMDVILSQSPQEGTNPADTLTLDFQPLEL